MGRIHEAYRTKPIIQIDTLGIRVVIHTDTAAEIPTVERHSADHTGVLADLWPEVDLAALAARRGGSLLLHAAGVASDGRVPTLLVPSGQGKATGTPANHIDRTLRELRDHDIISAA